MTELLTNASEIPLWVKLGYTLLLCIILPVYVVRYGWTNLLWFSDVALIATGIALWLESPLLASMMTVGVLLPELVWNASFFGRLLFGVRTNLAAYMFEAHRPLWLRGLSLFHVGLPPLLLWLIDRLGYDPRALAAQTLLAWMLLLASYLLTDPRKNINWVFGPGAKPQQRLSPGLYLILVMLLFPLVAFLPTHLILDAVFGSDASR